MDTLRKSFFTDPAVMELILDTTEDTIKKINYAYRLGFINDSELLDYKLKQLPTLLAGNEDIMYTFKHWIRDIVTLISRVGNRVYKLGRHIVESIGKQYEFAARMWESRIQEHIDDIHEDHFNKEIVEVCNKDIFLARCKVVGRIHQLLEHMESVVNSPIRDVDDPNSYNTPEFISCYKDLKDIGFDMTNKTFTESRSQGYTSQVFKDTIANHGYSKSYLPELAQLAKTIATTSTKKWLEDMVKKFKTLNTNLVNYEKATMSNKVLDQSKKEIELKKVQIKISRLWWISNFVHLLQQLSEDCMTYILRIFRAADDSIPQATNPDADESDPNKYYF